MAYKITEYTKKQAKKLNVDVKPSSKKNKKIDVFKGGHLIASVGSLKNFDYPSYIEIMGKAYADKRRALYKLRHDKDRHKINTPGFYADRLLW
jgi:hypothetical protein